MTITSPSSEHPRAETELRDELLRCLRSARVVDPSSGFINLDKLWEKGFDGYRSFIRAFSEYLRQYRSDLEFETVLCANTMVFPFGAAALMFALGSIGSITNAIVWNEWIEAPTRMLKFRGDVMSAKRILILQDATSTGSTVVQMMCDLKHLGQKDVVGMLTLVDCGKGAADYIQKKAEAFFGRQIKFKALFTLSELLGNPSDG